MLERIVVSIATKILEYLIGKAETEIRIRLAQLAEDRRQAQVNEENIKAYEAAKDRAERRRAALDLLNRTRSAP